MNRPDRRSALVLAMVGLLAGLGADREVQRIHVPAGKVGSFFPEGTDLKVLPLDRFEDLLRAARDRPEVSRSPRVVRVTHAATWNSGILSGRSEFFVDQLLRPTDLIALEPWSPAVTGGGPARATQGGILAIVVDRGSPVTLDWNLRSRNGSEGRSFALSIPDVEISSLTLDLPTGLIPEGNWTGLGPGPTPDSRAWRREAARGQIDLRLRSEVDRPVDPSKRWLEGPTRIDLADPSANWKAEWTVEDLPGASDRLTIELDPDLDLIDVQGPRVRSFRVEPRPAGDRVSILLHDPGQGGATSLMIRALCRAPTEGRWLVPSARPVDATWTGGRTSIRLDPSRVLQSCSDRAGRRIGPGPGGPAQPSALIFESTGAEGPVAELTFRRPTADASVEVHGHLRLDDDAPRIAVELAWTVDRGRLLSYSADLPPGWAVDRVITPAGLPVPWHAETLSSGGSRVQMSPSASVEESKTLTLILEASNRRAGTRGPIDLPRVRPSTPGLRVADEVWLATSKPDLDVRPILERGLAWLDPVEKGTSSSSDLRRALAWRWLAEDAEARVDRSTVRSPIRGDARLDAQVIADRLQLDWTVVIEPGSQAIRSIPIYFDDPTAGPIRWRFVGPANLLVEVRPLPESARVAQGFPNPGSAWALELSLPVRGRIEIRGHAERPWPGSGHIPILGLPTRFASRGLVSVAVPETSRSNLPSSGLTAVDLSQSSTAAPRPADDPAGDGQPRPRQAGMFAYEAIGGHLALETTAVPPGPSGGVVREAFLATQVFPGSGLKHHLTLRVVATEARFLELTMPAGVNVDRLRRDGQSVSARARDGKLEIAIPVSNRRPHIISLEYRTTDGLGDLSVDLRSILPACSMPCLSFNWEISTPDPWTIGSISDELVSTDSKAIESWATRLLGFRPWPRSRPADREAMLSDLDRPIDGATGEETTLGELLLRLDAGRWPLVLDRLAMHKAGWGPMSRLGSVAGDAKTRPTAASILSSIGLIAVPISGSTLITTRAEAPGPGLEDWQQTINRAATTGSDENDRFQSVARWWGEPTPRAQTAGEPVDRSPVPSGWKTHYLISAGWPGAGTSIRIVDDRWVVVNGWLVMGIVILAGYIARKSPARVRAVGLASAVMVALGLLISSGPESSVAIGLIRGGIVVVVLWTFRSIRKVVPEPVNLSDATTVMRRARPSAGSAALVLVVLSIGLPTFASADLISIEGPIVVLLPFEGAFDPKARAEKVVMRLDDFEALERLAGPIDDRPKFHPVLKSIVHGVRREEPGTATVESRFEVEAGEASEWTIPIGTARDLVATVDEQSVPIRISPDGISATIAIPGPGVHAVTFRRIVPLSVQSGVERFRLPVNRSAFARVDLAKIRPTERVELVNASGVGGDLGPVADLEVAWFPEDGAVDDLSAKSPVEAAILWDARPSGDMVRARFRHSNPDGISTFRLAVEPDVLIRDFQIPGVVSVGREGPTEWVARVDPPIPAGEPIGVNLWRPARAGVADRSLPRFEVMGMGRLGGVIGFRRGVDAMGRLDPQGHLEPMADPAFEKIWGPMPDDGLVLAGAARFAEGVACRVASGPIASKRSARTTVAVDLKPGRLDATIDLNLEDRQGRSFDLEMALPADFRIIRVEATGLADWQRLRERLRLQFDGSEVRERSIQIRGYLVGSADPAIGDGRTFQAKVPWPRLLGVESDGGSLVVNSPNRFQMEAGDGVVVTSLTESQESRVSYRVDRPEGLGPIRWSSPSARVAVAVRSHLAVDPGRVAWTSVVDCEVSGGPAESLSWRLPAAWAKDATLEVDGVPVKPVSEVKESLAYWTITPVSPIWGRARLVLRSSRPIVAGESFDYPEVAPRAASGRGTVLSYDLTVANLSGRPIEFAGSPGLQAIDASSFTSVESGPVDRAYHVTGEKWNLRLRIGPAEGCPQGKDRPARVTNSQLSVATGLDGQQWGRARYNLDGRPATFLEVNFPSEGDIPWATVDGSLAPTLRQGEGRWLIPLGDRAAKRVQLVWHRGVKTGTNELAIPSVGQPDTPTMISVTASRSIQIETSGERLLRLDQAAWEMKVAEEAGRRIVRALSDFDRASPREHETVVDDIADFELRVRTVGRLAPKVYSDRIQAARLMIDDSGQIAGLDELVAEGRSLVGIVATPSDRAIDAVESTEALRVRRVGETSYFDGLSGVGTSILTWQARRDWSRWARLDVGVVLVGGLIASFGVWFSGRSRVG